MSAPPKFSDWISLLLLTLMWGTAFLVQEIALKSYAPGVIAGTRIAFAAIVLCLATKLTGGQLPSGLKQWGHMTVVALLGTVIPFNLIAWGQLHIESALAGILMAVMPLYVMTLAHFFVPGERLTPGRAVGFLFGFGGVACVIGPEALSLSAEPLRLLGMLAVLGAGIGYATASIYARRISLSNPTSQAAAMMIIASLACVPMVAAEIRLEPIYFEPKGVAAILCLGALSTGLASVLYFRIIQGPGPTFLSIVSYLIPVCAVLAGSLILDESLDYRALWGMALILVGIALSEIGPVIRKLFRDRSQRMAAPSRNKS